MKKIKIEIKEKNKYDEYLDDEDNLSIIINIKNGVACLLFLVILIIIPILYLLSIYFQRNKYRNYINVSYAFDGNYHYIAHVSMKSLMLSQDKTTFINFYILVSNLNEEQKEVIIFNKDTFHMC